MVSRLKALLTCLVALSLICGFATVARAGEAAGHPRSAVADAARRGARAESRRHMGGVLRAFLSGGARLAGALAGTGHAAEGAQVGDHVNTFAQA